MSLTFLQHKLLRLFAFVRRVDWDAISKFGQEGAAADAVSVVDDRLEHPLPQHVVADGLFPGRIWVLLGVIAQNPTIVMITG